MNPSTIQPARSPTTHFHARKPRPSALHCELVLVRSTSISRLCSFFFFPSRESDPIFFSSLPTEASHLDAASRRRRTPPHWECQLAPCYTVHEDAINPLISPLPPSSTSFPLPACPIGKVHSPAERPIRDPDALPTDSVLSGTTWIHD